MDHKRFFYAFAVAIAFVFAMQHFSGPSDQKSSLKNLRYEDLDDTALGVGSTRANRIRISTADAKAIAANGQLTQHQPNANPTETPSAPAKAAPDATVGVNMVDDPKAAAAAGTKKDEKKKAKKKKKKIKGKNSDEVAQSSPAKTDVSDSDRSDSETETDGPRAGLVATNPVGGTAVVAPNTAKKNEIPQTLREWEEILLRDPDLQKTQKFVQYFQANQIPAEVFYRISKQMTEDTRPRMRELGIMALGTTPSVRSFNELVSVSASEPAESSTRVQIQTYLLRYTDLTNVRFLGLALNATSKSPNASQTLASLEAIRLVRVSADRYLKPLLARNPAEEPEQAPPQAAPSPAPRLTTAQRIQLANYFKTFVTLFERLESQNQQPEIKDAAKQAAASLQVLIAGASNTGPQQVASAE